MKSPTLGSPVHVSRASRDDAADDVTLAQYIDVLVSSRRLIGMVMAVCLAVGLLYALLAQKVYQADILVQIEDSPGSAKSLLGDVSGVFDVKTQATAEIEVLRSRLVLGKAVDHLRLDIVARPLRLPLVGERLAAWHLGLSRPGLFGFGGYAWGAESAQVTGFDVPEALEGVPFSLTALADNRFQLTQRGADVAVEGKVGQLLEFTSNEGRASLYVSALNAAPGTAFVLVRKSRLKTLEELQGKLNISEKGKDSGILGVSLTDANRVLVASILNEIGDEYVNQNIRRKTAEAEKSLTFLNKLAPEQKARLEQAESSYNAMRNARDTFNLSEEGKSYLQEKMLAETRLLELKQRRTQLIERFTASHPSISTVDQQIAALNAKVDSVSQRMKKLPDLEQDSLRLMRDVRVNNDLYVNLTNTIQQLKMVEAKVGTVRLLDNAVPPVEAVKPNRPMVVAMAAVIGLVLGVGAALVRFSLRGGVTHPQDIVRATGLSVFATVPLSLAQASLRHDAPQDVSRDGARNVLPKRAGRKILASHYPTDPSVESLRSVRMALQSAMLEASDNRILVTGPTPGVGKSFISANLAALMASTGRRVLLIDADLRKGHLNRYVEVSRKPGLSDALAKDLPPEMVIHRNVLPGLDFIPCGTFEPNPTELLMGKRVSSAFDAFCEGYDLVLIDSPPVLAASDAALLAGFSGTVLLVTRFDTTSVDEVAESVATLRQANVQVRGVILNGWDQNAYRFGYGSRYMRSPSQYYGYGTAAAGGER